jgi:hypothetical protein
VLTALTVGLLAGFGGAPGAPTAVVPVPGRVPAAVLERNLAVPTVATPAVLDSLLAAEQGEPVAARVGRWARRYLAWGEAGYRFGLADGGYVDAGLLVPGRRQDCISLLYRVTELAQARSARQAVALALQRRFAGAPASRVCRADGRVDYDDPAHLDYSLDMIRSGRWGRDVTGTLTGARPDSLGTARYPAGSFRWVPQARLRPQELAEGDILWLVLDPGHEAARRLRQEHGLVIGHVGVVVVEDGQRRLIHAASRPLPGHYDAPGIRQVPVRDYLARVGRHGGVMVTRFSDRPAAPPGSPGRGR